MSNSRVEIFEQMLRAEPENTAVMFGLAKEYEKAERHEGVVNVLTKYLETADDEGNAYGMLGRAYEKLGRRDDARRAYERGIEVANAHGHPSMAEDYRMLLETGHED